VKQCIEPVPVIISPIDFVGSLFDPTTMRRRTMRVRRRIVIMMMMMMVMVVRQ
jgi:hypothetical protein